MSERSKEQTWEQRTQWPLALVAIAFLTVYSVHVLYRPHGAEPSVFLVVAWVSWGVYVADWAVTTVTSIGVAIRRPGLRG